MRQSSALLVLAWVPVLAAAVASAQTVHVPADYATIQAAINSGAALVYVSQGTYAETLAIQRTVTLLPETPADPKASPPFPRVAGMHILRNDIDNPLVYLRGFHFTGPVSETTSSVRGGITTIEGCRLGAGFQTLGSSGIGETIQIRSCVITGDVLVVAYNADFTGNMVWKGQARVHANGYGAVIRDNLVIGPSAAGLLSTSGDSPGLMSGNVVSGVTTGYSLTYGTASDNVAQDCGGAGFTGSGYYGGGATFSGNVARRCGEGFSLSSAPPCHITGNQVDSAGTVGIHTGGDVVSDVRDNTVTASGSHGIWVEMGLSPSGNRVTYSGGDGIRASERPERNVVGRSAGRGIVAPEARHNTVFLNGGSGLELSGTMFGPDSVTHNVAYGNGGHGLRWTGALAPFLGCNDWCGNAAGPTLGVGPGGSDMGLDPLFCSLPTNDVTLASGSPLLAPAGCGPVGALGSGCTSAASVPPAHGEVASFTARPNPARGTLEMRWAQGADACRIEVFDVTGAVRFRIALPAGVNAFPWSGRDQADRLLPAGIYFVHRVTASTREQARVVLER